MSASIAASSITIVDGNNPGINKAPVTITEQDMSTASAIFQVDSTNPLPYELGNGVRLVKLHEYKEAALCLAEAFVKDDVARYFIDTPDRAHWSEAQKWDLHVKILEYITYAHLLKGVVLTAGEDWGCVALWMPPGKNMDDWWTILRSGMWRLSFMLSAEGRRRFFDEFLPLLHTTKSTALGVRDDDSYYLVYLGTKAHARGKGLARKCVEVITKVADQNGKACYLESSNAKNPALYRKWGFEIVDAIRLNKGDKDVELDIMIREPVKTETTDHVVARTTK